MSLSAKEQEDYYHAYWSKIEKLTDGEPTMFIRDYLTIKKGTISNIEDLYFDFKTFDEETHTERKNLLEDMLKYAKFYRQILKGETGNTRIDRKLKQIANIESLVHLPYILSFLIMLQKTMLAKMRNMRCWIPLRIIGLAVLYVIIRQTHFKRCLLRFIMIL